MTINFKELNELLAAIAANNITELTLKNADFELTVSQGQPQFTTVTTISTDPSQQLAAAPTPSSPAVVVNQVVTPAIDKNWLAITSPMVGTFYRSPAPRTTLVGMGLQEQECIRLLVKHGRKDVDPNVAPGITLTHYMLGEIDGIDFVTPIYIKFLIIFRENFSQQNILNEQFFISHENFELQQEAINLSSERHSLSQEWEKHEIFTPNELEKLADLAYQNILRLKMEYFELKMNDYLKNYKLSKDTEEQDKLFIKYKETKDLVMQISKELGTVVKQSTSKKLSII